MKTRTTLLAAAIAATVAIGATAAFIDPDLVVRMHGDAIALKADEGVPQNLVTA